MNKLGFTEEEVEQMTFYKFLLLYDRYKQVFNYEKNYEYSISRQQEDELVEIVSF